MNVEYITGSGLEVQQTMNQAELTQLLQADNITLIAVNRQPKAWRIYRHRKQKKLCLKGETA